YNILRTRIDKFGVAAPTINLDEAKSIITIELAGVADPERVRKYLQSTANLQFFEVYNIGEIDQSMVNAQKALADYLNGVKVKDTGLLNSYLNLQFVKDKFPANLAFMYGKPEGSDPKAKNILPFYAVKTIEGPALAKLEGEHVTDAGQDYDERGRVAIKMNM